MSHYFSDYYAEIPMPFWLSWTRYRRAQTVSLVEVLDSICDKSKKKDSEGILFFLYLLMINRNYSAVFLALGFFGFSSVSFLALEAALGVSFFGFAVFFAGVFFSAFFSSSFAEVFILRSS